VRWVRGPATRTQPIVSWLLLRYRSQRAAHEEGPDFPVFPRESGPSWWR
jgi:hypothetical protein